MKYDYLIVGCGFYGATLAERIANDKKKTVLVIDKKDHIGGNSYSAVDQETGIEYHKYGTHIFHTSNEIVMNYLNRFCELNGYHHQVLTTHKNKVYQMPINLETINSFYNLNLKPSEAKEFIKNEIEKTFIKNPNNLEEKAISLIGKPIYEAFIKGYTSKQWEKDTKDLPPYIITRLPVRYNYNEDYFNNCRWQGIPLNGFTNVFENMLNFDNIEIRLNCDYFKVKDTLEYDTLVYTGPLDQLYNYKFGKLEWRSVEFKKELVDVDDFQGTSVMNYADLDIPYTRIHEPRHLHPERGYTSDNSIIFYETSHYCTSDEDPYYPIHDDKNMLLYEKYQKLIEKDDIIIGGRLGNYKYYDIDKAVETALEYYETMIR